MSEFREIYPEFVPYEQALDWWCEYIAREIYLNSYIDPMKVTPHRVLSFDEWIEDDYYYTGSMVDGKMERRMMQHRHYRRSEDVAYYFNKRNIETFASWFKRI
jgi:hypothetical protein